MKSIGAVFSVAAFLLWGFSYINEEKRKMKAYYGLSDAFLIMKNELCATLTPLYSLTERALSGSEGCVKSFFQNVLNGFESIGKKDFSLIWNEAAEESFEWLSPEQYRMLCFPGSVLGKSAGETQAQALEGASSYFRAEAEKKKEKMPEIRKLAIGLSACAGLMTVLTLY